MGKTIFGTILNTKVNKDGRIFVKVEYQGDPLGFEAKEDVKQDTINTDSLRFKVTKANQSSPSSVKATENYSAIIGSSTNRIVSSNKYGNIIAGPVVFTAHPENIRLGGVFRINGQVTSTMPSTIVTPIPLLKFDYPLKDALKGIADMVSEYEEFLAGIL